MSSSNESGLLPDNDTIGKGGASNTSTSVKQTYGESPAGRIENIHVSSGMHTRPSQSFSSESSFHAPLSKYSSKISGASDLTWSIYDKRKLGHSRRWEIGTMIIGILLS